jgi:D-amino-acid dehydrogenase
MIHSTNPEVTVIGAGIVGLCCTLSLLEKGNSVRLIDPLDDDRRASIGNAGVISPWSCVPQSMPGLWKKIPGWLLNPEGPISLHWSGIASLLPWTIRFMRQSTNARVKKNSDAMFALNRPNTAIYQHHLKGTGAEHLIRDSYYIQAYRDARSLDANSQAMQLFAQNATPLEIVDGHQLRQIEPAISDRIQKAVIIKSQARTISPGQLCDALLEKVKRMGAEVLMQPVKTLTPDSNGSWIIQTDTDTLSAKKVVVSAGVWSKIILEKLGVSVPLIAERGYHLEFTDPQIELNHLVMDVDRKFVISSMADGVRAAGTAEFANLNTKPNYRRAEIFSRLAKNLLPDLNTAESNRWMGIRPSFPDSLPCIGEVPGHANLFAAFGHSHYGMGMAPKTGQLIANIVNQHPTDIDIRPYDIRRFNR